MPRIPQRELDELKRTVPLQELLGAGSLKMKRMRGKMIIILIVSRKMISFLQLMNQLMTKAYLLQVEHGRNMLVGLVAFLNH